jgi:hypothetical protein
MSFSMSARPKASHRPPRPRRMSSFSRHEAEATAARERGPGSTDRRRHGGATQDRALYSCGCGCAFDAPVSTSVDCPHCGDRQAW